jgi:CNT family concentrative nucleoside transporter
MKLKGVNSSSMLKRFFFLLSFSLFSFFPLLAQTESIAEDTLSLTSVTNESPARNMPEEVVQAEHLAISTSRFNLLMRGILGMSVLLLLAFLFSCNRKAVSLRLVLLGLFFQITLALAVWYIGWVKDIITFIGNLFVLVLDSSAQGAEFLFGGFMDSETYGFIFAFEVLPTIIFFSALMSLLFYLGIVQKIVFGAAWLLKKALGMSGPESLAVAGNVFLGQTESPLLIKAYLSKLTGSEIFVVMVSGMATIAGGVLAAYVGMLAGDDTIAREEFARHLVTASVMAAPGAVVIAKIIFPQTESIDKNISVPRDEVGQNVLDAISKGAYEGLKLAANVAIMLLVFVSFIKLFNIFLDWTGRIPVQNQGTDTQLSLNEIIATSTNGFYAGLSLEYLLGQIFAPLMWLIGVPNEDLSVLGRLMGEKIIFTEFISFDNLKTLIRQPGAIRYEKSVIMATFMLCGFANIASVGIQIGGIGALAPNKRVFLSKYGIRALLGGTLASLLSATIIGVIA